MTLVMAGLVCAGEAPPSLQVGRDYHSFANVDQFRVSHIALNLKVDFERRELYGAVTLEIARLDPRATQLVLDSRDITVLDVTQLSDDIVGASEGMAPIMVKRPFRVGKPDPILGSALVIDIPPSRHRTETVRIEYETSPRASGLQWLTPAQTAGKRKPFLFTQSESIQARSWIPLQDTPQVRATYSAHIVAPDDFLAVMSAANDPKAHRNGDFSFVMPQAIPSYLIALAVGDLVFRATGPRTGVYAERPVIRAAAREFADTEAMIETCEKLFGPYRWGRYDILILPPSFPQGGMENPRLSFITPTVIAGDKSLVSVIAHELSHSWAGNLVTNATWRDLWLNEGFTVYLERRIMTAIYGENRAAMEDVLGLSDLRKDLARLPQEDQILAIDLRGRNPEDVFSAVPYEKGRLFLVFLASRFGQSRFDDFLHAYFDHFAFQSISTEQFLGFLQENLLDKHPGIVSSEEIRAWVFGAGVPADAILPSSAAFAIVDAARSDWLAGRTPAAALDTRGWATQQWVHFLNEMPAPLRAAQLAELDKNYRFTASANAEILHSWLLLAIRSTYQPAYARLESYLRTIGRKKLILPLYQELLKTPGGTQIARRIYALARSGYHPLTAESLDEVFMKADAGATGN